MNEIKSFENTQKVDFVRAKKDTVKRGKLIKVKFGSLKTNKKHG